MCPEPKREQHFGEAEKSQQQKTRFAGPLSYMGVEMISEMHVRNPLVFDRQEAVGAGQGLHQ